MDWLAKHWLHLSFVLVYLAILVRHAWVGSRHAHSLSDYLVAGRGLGGVVVALSFYATFMSTNTFIGAAGKSWKEGLLWCAGIVVYVGCCYASWYVVAPRFVPLTREYGSLTVADFLGYRYQSDTLRRAAAVIVAVASILYLVAVYRGSALALVNLLDLRYELAIVLIFLVVTGYTLAGGFESVVLTDAMQGLLMVAGAVTLVVAVLAKGGGFIPVIESLQRQNPDWVSWQSPQKLFGILGIALAFGIKFLVEPRLLSRFYGLKDRGALRIAAVLAPLLILVTYVALLPIGAFAHALIPTDAVRSSDDVIPHLLSDLEIFGPVFGSLFLLVLMSAAMSSIDSVLLVAASSVDHDLINPGLDDARAVNRTRVWVVALSIASMCAALMPWAKDIVTVTALSGSLYGACFLAPLVVGLFWRRATAAGAMASILVGGLAVVGWFIAKRGGWTHLHEVYVGLAVGFAVFVFVSLVSARPTEESASPPGITPD